MNGPNPPWRWRAFFTLQSTIDHDRGPAGAARDTALSVLTDELQSWESEDAMRRRFFSLTLNRGATERTRRARRQFWPAGRASGQGASVGTDAKEILENIRDLLEPADWDLLVDLARGLSYAALAVASRTTPGALRVRATRARYLARTVLADDGRRRFRVAA